MNYHGRIVERNEGRMGLWRNVSWSVLSESVILDMVTAFTRLHKSSSHGIPIIWKVPPLMPNRPRSYLPPVPIPRMAANRSILTMRWKPVIISLRSVGFSTMLMSRWTGDMVCHLHAILKQGTRQVSDSLFNVGGYKTRPNFIGNPVTPTRTALPQDVPEFMDRLFDMCTKLLRMNRIRSPVSIGRLRRFTHFRTATVESDGLSCSRSFLRIDALPVLGHDAYRAEHVNGISKFPDEPGWLVDTLLFERDLTGRMF